MSERDWTDRANELSAEAIAAGEPDAWFDRLYAEGAAGEIDMPWGRTEPLPTLVEWLDGWLAGGSGEGSTAVVVGCGLGADAEHVASRGFATTGFDLSQHAIVTARRRHPASPVAYRTADLLDLDADLVGRFDLVVEIFTLQAIPEPPRTAAAAGVVSLLAPGGTLFVFALRQGGQDPEVAPPFPLTRDDLALLEVGGVSVVSADELDLPGHPAWRAVLRRG